MSTIASLPWVVIPGVLVPLYLMTHLAIFAQLARLTSERRRANQGGGLAWEYAPDSWAQLTPTTESIGGRDRLRRTYQAAAGWTNGPASQNFPATVQSAAARALR